MIETQSRSAVRRSPDEMTNMKMMKTRWLVVAALPLLAIPLAHAQKTGQKPEAGSKGRLTRVLPRGGAQDDA